WASGSRPSANVIFKLIPTDVHAIANPNSQRCPEQAARAFERSQLEVGGERRRRGRRQALDPLLPDAPGELFVLSQELLDQRGGRGARLACEIDRQQIQNDFPRDVHVSSSSCKRTALGSLVTAYVGERQPGSMNSHLGRSQRDPERARDLVVR